MDQKCKVVWNWNNRTWVSVLSITASVSERIIVHNTVISSVICSVCCLIKLLTFISYKICTSAVHKVNSSAVSYLQQSDHFKVVSVAFVVFKLFFYGGSNVLWTTAEPTTVLWVTSKWSSTAKSYWFSQWQWRFCIVSSVWTLCAKDMFVCVVNTSSSNCCSVFGLASGCVEGVALAALFSLPVLLLLPT